MSSREANHAIPRIYLDSDTLIKGLIENLSEVQNHPRLLRQEGEIRLEIEPAKQILTRWNPKLCLVSMHALMETLDCGVRQYELPLTKVASVLTDSCGTDFSVIFADIDTMKPASALVEAIENKIPLSSSYASIHAEGIARNEKGEPLGTVRWGGTLSSGGFVSPYRSGSPAWAYSQDEVKDVTSQRVSAPKLERELFLRAVELSESIGLAPKDALHVVVAKGRADYIVTTDSAFLRVLTDSTARGLPRGAKPSDLLRDWGTFLES